MWLFPGRSQLLAGNTTPISERPPPPAPRALVTSATGPGLRPLYTRQVNAPGSSMFRPASTAVPVQSTTPCSTSHPMGPAYPGRGEGFRPPPNPAQLLRGRAGVGQPPGLSTPSFIRPTAMSPASRHVGGVSPGLPAPPQGLTSLPSTSQQRYQSTTPTSQQGFNSTLPTNQQDFISLAPTNQQGFISLPPTNQQGFIPQQPNTQQGSSQMGETFSALNKNPISALMEYAQSRKMEATIELMGESGPPHRPR